MISGMNPWRIAIITAIGSSLVVALVVTLSLTLGGETLPSRLDPSQCPADYGHRPVLLVSLDGFRADYLQRGLTPTIQRMAENGVHSPFMMSSFPTVTFSNHYSIVTGLYPESHGIISNYFFDPVFQANFSLRTSVKFNGTWWGGEPIWNTLARHGKKSATFFWPGSDADIHGMHPTYWRKYDRSVPYRNRVQQVLEWLSLKADERPAWVCLYLNEPDHEGHATGPYSPQLNEKLQVVDNEISRLMEGLAERQLEHCVNILVVSDHGMAQSGPDKVISLERFVPEIDMEADVFSGASPGIRLRNDNEETKLDILQRLSCQEKMRVFRREDLPKRLHYTNNRRINDLVLHLDPGYSVEDINPNNRKKLPDHGFHGYDYYFSEMNALFVGYGPDLQHGLEVEPFHNIELYNLMTILTGVAPVPNNGTWGALHHLLANPPPNPIIAKEVQPPTLCCSGNGAESQASADCDCNLAGDKGWLSALIMTASQREEAEARHLPWGTPHSATLKADMVLLHHLSHVTGYSQLLKVPLWTSFTVEDKPFETPLAAWSSDPRLKPSAAPSLTDFSTLANFTMTPLFPPWLAGSPTFLRERNDSGDGNHGEVPYLVSNGVAMSNQLAERWRHLVEQMVPRWFDKHGPINVVLGPVYDADDDSHHDNLVVLRTPAVPTDMFAVVTRCLKKVTSLDLCPHQSLDSISFIFPQFQAVTNCLSAERYAQIFSAEVRDVELATGLTFFPALTFPDRVRVILRVHPDLWE